MTPKNAADRALTPTPHGESGARRRADIPFSVPSVGDEEIAAVAATMRSGWLTTGPKAAEFERAFETFLTEGAAPSGDSDSSLSAIALNSCSAGLHAALHVLGIGSGDAVITTPYTFAATAHAIEHVGAEPVFADVDPRTLNLCPAAAARAVAQARSRGLRPAVLLPVHFAGHPADMAAFEALALANQMSLVEDAAHALPARVGVGTDEAHTIGVPSCVVPSFVTFSFYANKNLTTGDGGMLVGPPDLIQQARVFCGHGVRRRGPHGGSADARRALWQYDVIDTGFKYGLTDMAAAMGLVQLRRLPAFHARRTEIAARYQTALADAVAAGLELPTVARGSVHAWHLYVVRLPLGRLRISRDQFVAALADRKIGSSVHFRPLPEHSYFAARGHTPLDVPVAVAESARALSLPLYPAMSDQDVDDVAAAVLDTLRAYRV